MKGKDAAMKEKLIKNWPWLVMLALFFACAVLLNVFSIPAGDELCNAFGGQSTSMHTDWPRISSLMDIVRQQYSDYMNATGRVFVHGITAFFSGFRLNYAFDVINSFMWLLFVLLIMDEAKIELNIRRYACGCMFVFVFWWYAETVHGDIDIATDYILMAVSSLIVMRLWRNQCGWWTLPIAFIFGWGQETYSIPMLCALVGSILIRSIKDRCYVASARQTGFVLAMVAGVTMLVLSPGVHKRAEASLDFSPASLAYYVAKWIAGMMLAIWPMVILICFLIVLWRVRKRFVEYFLENLEWLLFMGASIGLSVLTVSNGLYRICSGWIMVCVMLYLKDRKEVFLDSRKSMIIAWMALAWMVSAAGFQIEYGLQNYRMLRIYKEDSQGITYREIVPPTIWNNISNVGIYNHFHLNCFRLDCNKSVCPIILTKPFYDNLYLDPAKFFVESVKVGESFVRPDMEGVAVKLGKTTFSEAEISQLKERLVRRGWRKLVPGRFRTMFPSPAEYVNLPVNLAKEPYVSFVAKDGNWYTICKYTD